MQDCPPCPVYAGWLIPGYYIILYGRPQGREKGGGSNAATPPQLRLKPTFCRASVLRSKSTFRFFLYYPHDENKFSPFQGLSLKGIDTYYRHVKEILCQHRNNRVYANEPLSRLRVARSAGGVHRSFETGLAAGSPLFNHPKCLSTSSPNVPFFAASAASAWMKFFVFSFKPSSKPKM